MNLTLVIPTISRPSLLATLNSLRKQNWQEGDEILVVGDGPQETARCIWEASGLPGRFLETPEQLGSWGHGVRNWVNTNRLAKGDYVAALDDDDVWTPEALDTVRRTVAEAPSRPILFKMAVGTLEGKKLWKDKNLKVGNVGTPMLVAPNDPWKLGTWGTEYGGDGRFIIETCKHYPEGPVWHEGVLCVIRPHDPPKSCCGNGSGVRSGPFSFNKVQPVRLVKPAVRGSKNRLYPGRRHH